MVSPCGLNSQRDGKDPKVNIQTQRESQMEVILVFYELDSEYTFHYIYHTLWSGKSHVSNLIHKEEKQNPASIGIANQTVRNWGMEHMSVSYMKATIWHQTESEKESEKQAAFFVHIFRLEFSKRSIYMWRMPAKTLRKG